MSDVQVTQEKMFEVLGRAYLSWQLRVEADALRDKVIDQQREHLRGAMAEYDRATEDRLRLSTENENLKKHNGSLRDDINRLQTELVQAKTVAGRKGVKP